MKMTSRSIVVIMTREQCDYSWDGLKFEKDGTKSLGKHG
jgi:hypothetical protein